MDEVGQSLVFDILSGKNLLKLVGGAGSGKTSLCAVLEEQLPESYRVVVLSNPSFSFEELLRHVEYGKGSDEKSVQATLSNHVLIIDEAEKMFTATLERLLHLVTEEAGKTNLTLLLVGRPELDERLAQMAALGTEVVFDVSYQLEPFSESDIRQYIRHRCTVAGMSPEHFTEVFTEPVITKIIADSQGNPRQINTLGEEALQSFCAEKSFMVLLDRVEPEAIEEPVPVSRVVELYELLLEHKRLTGGVTAAFLLILGVGILLYSSGNRSATTPMPMASDSATLPQPVQPGKTSPTLSLRDQRDGEALFRERLRASAGWLAGMYKGGYTIQLMMLASTSAEYSLADTLVQDDYYPLRDQFYILRKLTNPPTFFVFYGVYDSLEAAREARNSMPVFLRKHHPYPLAISEAMRKIEQ